VASVVPAAEGTRVSKVGASDVRVQTERLTRAQTDQVSTSLAQAYHVRAAAVTSSFIGASWGKDITDKALRALVIFLVLAAVVLALYFRTWKMSAAALIALVHDVVITAGVYSLSGFEVTPATVIGFLTILGYSLYDTVVVFDKVRENTANVLSSSTRTFAEASNLAVNQTLVRSINTSVVALLPVGSILFIGAYVLGAGTLRDISLALFVGILAGAYSSIFIAPPLFAQLVERQPEVRRHRERVLARRSGGGAAAGRARSTAGAAAAGGSSAATATAVLERPGDLSGDAQGDRAGEDGGGSSAATASRARRAARGPRNQPVRRPGGRRR
jgi:preprotein translocase subunit SecF